jgi:hypothetical protein
VSEHFRVRTDLDAPAAAETVRSLEETRAAMLSVVWPRAPGPPGRTEVVALRDEREITHYLGRYVAGVRVETPNLPPMIVIGGARDRTARQTVKHELAHAICFWFFPFEPLWLAEGLATYLETVEYDRDKHRVSAGDVPGQDYVFLRRFKAVPARELFGVREEQQDVRLAFFETSSWLLVHYLINRHGPAFGEYQKRIARLEIPERAWTAEFADLPLDGLDGQLAEYLARGSYVVMERPLTVEVAAVRERTLADAEVHGLRALLYAIFPGPRSRWVDEEQRDEILEALRQDPGALDALAAAFYLRASHPTGQRQALAARATRAHPESWLAWVMAADAAGRTGTAARTALERAYGVAPEEPEVVLRLVLLDIQDRRWTDTLTLTTLAMRRLHSHDVTIFAAHVVALAHLGRCEAASWYLDAVSAVAPPRHARAMNELSVAARRACPR